MGELEIRLVVDVTAMMGLKADRGGVGQSPNGFMRLRINDIGGCWGFIMLAPALLEKSGALGLRLLWMGSEFEHWIPIGALF